MEIKDEVISYIQCFNHISVSDLEEILEHLEDMQLLNEEGKKFRHELWESFIKRGQDDNEHKG